MKKPEIRNPKSEIEYIPAYERILEGYLRTGEEAFLLESYELGKGMLKSGLGTQFAADMHFRSLEKVKRKIGLGEFPDAGHNPAIPFLELTMAFGIAFRDQLGALLRFTEIVEAGKREWERTFDAISDAISLHDSEGLVIRANKAFCVLYGKTFKDVIGQSPWRLFHDRISPPRWMPAGGVSASPNTRDKLTTWFVRDIHPEAKPPFYCNCHPRY